MTTRREFLISMAAAFASSGPTLAEHKKRVPDIEFSFEGLIDQDGNPVSDETLKKGNSIIYFGYPMCRTVCPKALTGITEALAKTDFAVKAIYITAHPIYTAEQVKNWVRTYSEDAIGLTGPALALESLYTAFRIKGARDQHSPHAFLIKDGEFCGLVKSHEGSETIVKALDEAFGEQFPLPAPAP